MQNDDVEAQESASAPAVIGQGLLFSREIEIAVEAEEARGCYTLERFRVRRPEAYRACVQLLGYARPGYEGLRRIAKILGVHHMTVAAVRDSEGESIDTVRATLVRKLRTALDLQVDRLIEDPGCVPPNVIGMVIDQLNKNAELLDGRATTRSESTKPVDIHGDFEAFIQQLPSADAREIGSSAGEIPAIERAPIADREDPAAVPGAAAVADTDAESDVSPLPHEGTYREATALPTPDRTAEPAPAASPDVQNRAGGGAFGALGGVESTIDPASRKFSDNRPSPDSDL